jgi:hypothetical protein
VAGLDADQYLRLTPEITYGQSDGLFYDKTNDLLCLVINGAVVLSVNASGTVLAGALEAPDLSITSQTRGDLLRRGASAWERVAAKASGQLVMGDGTDVISQAVTGDVTISGAGVTAIGATKVLASMLGANLAKGYIPLDITTAKIISGNAIGNTTEGLLPDGNTDPSLARVNAATDKALRVIWAASSVVEVQFAPFAYPPDLDDTANVTVNFIAAMAGATDIPVLTVSYWEGVGDTDAGGATAAVTGTTLARYSRTIAATDVGAYPKVATVGVTPAAHGSDALHLYAAWVEYTRKS